MMRIKFKGKHSDIEVWKRTSVHPNYFISKKGRLWSLSTHIIGHGNPDKDGYYRHTFGSRNNQQNIRIHKLVATHFIPNPNNFETIDHIDGNKKNNNVTNLQWMSRGDNVRKSNLKNNHNPVRRCVICLETQKIYRNAVDAAKDTGVYPVSVLNCCKGINQATYPDYPSRERRIHWRYATKAEEEAYMSEIKS